MPIGGRTRVINAVPGAGAGHLVAPKDLDLGSLRSGETARGKLRIANNGTALLTGSVRVGPNVPWLRVLGSGAIYCAVGAVEAVDVQVDTSSLRPGKHAGTVLLDTDGGKATVQVSATVFRESLLPAIVAAVITAVAVLGIVGLVYAANGGSLPFATRATATATPRPTATEAPTTPPLPSATSRATATTVNVAATETAVAKQAQRLVASAGATATASAMNVAATDTAVADVAVNQSPGATQERLAIQDALNNFLIVRARALLTGDGRALPRVATGTELRYIQGQLSDLRQIDSHTKIVSIEAPLWDSILLHGPDSADATISKHEDEITIRSATGLPDDQDPSFHGQPHTLRNQRFAVTYRLELHDGAWLVQSHTVTQYPQPLPTPRPDLLPPPGASSSTASGTATALPTVSNPNGMSVEQVVQTSLPSVLRVTGTIVNNQVSTGTGFVIKRSGSFAYVVTNDHVVNGASNVTVTTQDGTALPAITLQEDSADDLAVIKVAQPAPALAPLTWGDSSSAQLGESVVAIGFALGLQGGPSVTQGVISYLHRNVGQPWPYLQHTAPINHGNSGGPLLDLNGTVIGINTLIDENAQSVFFAIPAEKAAQKVADLIGAMQ